MFVDKGIEAEARQFTTVARILHAAERQFGKRGEAGIYAGHARFDLFADFAGVLEVRSENRIAEPVT